MVRKTLTEGTSIQSTERQLQYIAIQINNVGVLFLFICACFNCLRRSVSCMSKCCPSL